MNDFDDLTLDLAADRLRSLHITGDPLVLVNAWDVASAREVVAAGGPVIGTSSAAISASVGEPDDNSMALSLAFGAIQRIASAVPVPVTADIEGGYDLDGNEVVGALLAAGAVGCNLEDTDHRRRGQLVDVDVMAAAGASRISFGPTFQRRAMADLRQRASELLGPAESSRGTSQ